MKIIKCILSICLLLSFLYGFGQQTVINPSVDTGHSFAIITDNGTYSACKDDLAAYQKSVELQGLSTYIISDDWANPEQIRNLLKDYYDNKNLEGAVFVGNIPIPMIRRAQHLTSAFKMDQNRFSMFESSVPSDRYYDDFDMKYKFICRDSVKTNFFYYNLLGDSPQSISCDIYSGRIRPDLSLDDKQQKAQISKYLQKVVKAKSEANHLDKVFSYTGHGSFSNSLAAWKDETVTLKEQMPAAFESADGARFYIFFMEPFMKSTIAKELQRKGLDVALFHEHGMPDRQYITSEPPATSMEEYYMDGRRKARQYIKQRMRYGHTEQEAREELLNDYGLDSTWFCDTFAPEVVKADSLYDLRTGITLQDVSEIKPNSLVTILDACYNGDFRENDCIAARYIFSDGDAVVGIGNSVNVLQDKSSSDLMGMLAMGYTVGEWMKLTNILESHIHGDPTFCFAPADGFVKPDLDNKEASYWLSFINPQSYCDLQGLALYKLYALNYEGMSDLLLKTFETSPYYMLRLQCMHLLAHYNDGNYVKLLKGAADDPYEFIRRKGVYYMGKVGDESFIPYIAKMYLDDYMSERVLFNIYYTSGQFPYGMLSDAVKKGIMESDFIFDKEAFVAEATSRLRSFDNTMKATKESIAKINETHRGQGFYISGMRNNPYPHLAADLMMLAENSELPVDIRVDAIETLGWFVRAPQKYQIAASCKKMLEDNSLNEAIKDELHKTINRLNDYMR